MILFGGIIFLVLSGYAALLGLGVVHKPAAWARRDEVLWFGRFGLLFAALMILDACGITPHRISEWLEDILTSGGGMGTG